MLKWTVMNKRETNNDAPATTALPGRRVSSGCTTQRRSIDAIRERKQRRHSARRASLCVRPGKENQGATTPSGGAGRLEAPPALRDVSNITPNANQASRRASSGRPARKSVYSEDDALDAKSPARPLHRQRKKQCLKNHFNSQASCDKTEGRRIIINERKCTQSCNCCDSLPAEPQVPLAPYSSTLPSFQMEYSPCLRSSQSTTVLNNPVISRSTLPCPSLPHLKSLTALNLDENCSPNKKPKIDHVNDFLHQISFITSPEDFRIRNLKAANRQGAGSNDVTVSPLLRKFVDLRFSQISYDKNGDNKDDSASFNDMSLDKIVDAILDTTMGSERLELRDSSRHQTQRDNEKNQVQEDNLINIAQENQSSCELTPHGNSKETVKKKVIKDDKDISTCTDSDAREEEKNLILNKNERFMNSEVKSEDDVNKRKRSSNSCSEEFTDNKKRNAKNVDSDADITFTLKRQRCVRRRRQTNLINNNNVTEDIPCEDLTVTPISVHRNQDETNMDTSLSYKEGLNDNSFSSSCMSAVKTQNFEQSSVLSQQLDCLGYSPWRKEICCGLSTPSLERFAKDVVFKRKRPLKRSVSSDGRDKPITMATSSTPTRCGDLSAGGFIDLQISHLDGVLQVNVFRCRDLQRSSGGPINAYVKVALLPDAEVRSKKRPAPQRTAVQAESDSPHFNHKFTFRLGKLDLAKRVQLEVWHRDRTQRRSEFLGCMSLPVKHAVKKDINGTYKLQSQSSGRHQNQPISIQPHHQQPPLRQQESVSSTSTHESSTCRNSLQEQSTTIMGENSQSSVEEAISLDDYDTEIVKKASSKTSLNQQQKDADENLFLRYLELDPMEGPEAIPAALQRKAIGNKGGKTPFTTTKRLTRQAKTGFGFSVVWTHPPRIERVEKGLPADKAGILPGDYIIFVDKHNVVMMPEIDILNLIRSYGSLLTLEIFRRNTSKNGGMTTATRPASAVINGSEATLPSVTFQPQHRPSTGCSTNTASVDLNRRRLHLPQVTFTSEKPASTPDEARKRAMYQLINKEQQYANALQFAVTRFVSALAERKDLVTPHEHHVLFQNSEEILRITEDIIESLVHDDGEPQIQLLAKTYEMKLPEIISAYKRYCAGLKKADFVLATKTKNCNSEFVRFLQTPVIPRRRPDITSFIHKPLEHYRDILKLLSTILSQTKSNQDDYAAISRVVHEMQVVYREITAEAGLMEPVGEGRPLLSVQDLENRLVFTKCKPFVLSKPGRQWIFGGDLSRVEGRTIRTYWALLFSDLILFAKVSRDRVLFITEEPLPLSHITEIYFNVRKKATEFRITVEAGGRKAQSPTAHCGPDLTRTPRKNAGRRCVVLRAPTMELKAVWQNLLQRQLFHVNSGVDGSSLSSPLDSPDVPITSSVATLQSAESLSIRRQAQRRVNSSVSSEMQKQIDELIEHKCKQLSKTSSNKGGAIHLEQWMKGQLGLGRADTPEYEPEPEVWTEEELRKRSEELQLVDLRPSPGPGHGIGHSIGCDHNGERNGEAEDSRCDELQLSDHDQSPSRSTTTESQVTVRSSPVVPEQVSVCKQCHETCLSNTNSPNLNIHHTNNNVIHNKCPANGNINNRPVNKAGLTEEDDNDNEWGSLMLMGLAAINPTTSFVKLDPFAPKIVPKIAVVPPTPDQVSVNNSFAGKFNYNNENTNSPLRRKIITNLDLVKDYEDSPDDSPQNEHPYIALDNCNQALRRFGTLSSLEKLTSDELSETIKNSSSDSEEEDEDDDENSTKTDPGQTAFTSLRSWTAKAGSYVSEKMAFFERFTDDSREGFFDRYLKQNEALKNSDEDGNMIAFDEECETSGATSGEEIWGTPTSGGELEDPLTFPNSDGGNVSPQSVNSTNGEDDTELMMDELLMAPPMTAAAVRGLLPRRRLEPLMEEDDSDTYTSSSSSEKATPSPEEGNGTGVVADDCSSAVARASRTEASTPSTSPVACISPPLARSLSYRHIVEEVEEATFLSRCSPQLVNMNIPIVTTKYKSIEPSMASARPKTTRLFDFFSARRSERRIHESFPGSRQLLRVFSKDSPIPGSVPNECTPQKPLSPLLNKDKQLDRRFWKQLSKRRRANRVPQIPA